MRSVKLFVTLTLGRRDFLPRIGPLFTQHGYGSRARSTISISYTKQTSANTQNCLSVSMNLGRPRHTRISSSVAAHGACEANPWASNILDAGCSIGNSQRLKWWVTYVTW